MIKEIVSLRRKGMSFRKIAEKLNSTVGKVHYQWLKYSNTKTIVQEKNDRHLSPSKKTDYFLLSNVTPEQKLVSHWKIAQWQKELVSSYFNQSANQDIISFRVYDVTDIYFNGANAHSFYEFHLPADKTNWTIKGLKKDRTYITEIGYNIEKQNFPLLRSNAVHISRLVDEPLNPHQLSMITSENDQASQPNWINNVSTYSYYESIDEVES